MGQIGSKVIEYRGLRSNLLFFLFPPRSLGQSSPNLVGRSKVKFMCFFFCLFPYFSQVLHFLKGQRSNLLFFVCSPTSPRSLDRSSPNLVQRLSVCLFPYSSQVLGPIFTKLGGKVEGGPGYELKGFIF